MQYTITKDDTGSYPMWEVRDETGFLWDRCYTPTQAEETVVRLEISDRVDKLLGDK